MLLYNENNLWCENANFSSVIGISSLLVLVKINSYRWSVYSFWKWSQLCYTWIITFRMYINGFCYNLKHIERVFNLHPRIYLLILEKRGKEEVRVRGKQLLVVSCMRPTQGQTRNQGMCLDWDQTHNLLVYGQRSNQLSHLARPIVLNIYNLFYISTCHVYLLICVALFSHTQIVNIV